jgi:hypothetical protein
VLANNLTQFGPSPVHSEDAAGVLLTWL